MEIKTKLKFSVITVCRNSEGTIERTIKSVLSQTFANIEYIIVDGASTDNTLPVIAKYKEQIARLISEPDTGVWDAYNKGINAATGDYVFFLNSDDCFISNHVLEKVNSLITSYREAPDVFYGKIFVLDEVNLWGFVTGIDYVSDRVLFLECVPHQSTFVRLSLMKERNYNTRYKLSGDFEWIVYGHAKNFIYKYADVFICLYNPFGISSDAKAMELRVNERVEVLTAYYSKPRLFLYLLYHYAKTLRYPADKRIYVRSILKRMKAKLFQA